MSAQETLRDKFLVALSHIGDVLTKASSPPSALSAVDIHTIAEGLFLFAFTQWEDFTRSLLITDLATNANSKLNRDVDHFHDPDAPMRLANGLLQHPDHPHKFIEWSEYGDVVSRANAFLGAGNRFAAPPLPRRGDLDQLKRVRNAIAHRSEKAWTNFSNLCMDPPFAIPPPQMKGMTPGRFLVDYHRHGQPVVRDTLTLLVAAARHLVP